LFLALCFLTHLESAQALGAPAQKGPLNQQPKKEPASIKGIHVSSWYTGSDKLFSEIISLIERTELNAVVIDCKDESGYVGWDSMVRLANDSGATSQKRIRDINKILAICRSKNIYPITRVVTFSDPVAARFMPSIAIQNPSGRVWSGKKGLAFLNPYCFEAWEYNVSLAKEAARIGFKEIQFDYIRFPSEGNLQSCRYPNRDARSLAEVIVGFLAYARKELAPYNVVLSADVFGQTGLEKGDMGIGQMIGEMAKYLDYICPMVYPSHYRKGVYGAKEPESEPYLIVRSSLRDIKAKLTRTNCKIRPWLQDFSLRKRYTQTEVRAQINACYDEGITEWLLWDPNCTFTESALEKEPLKK
jgi:hypothetical protein